jgi:hypothetical protein
MKFTKTPGSGVLPSTEDPTMILITSADSTQDGELVTGSDWSVPDTVTLPEQLGGGVVRVVRAFKAPCPGVGTLRRSRRGESGGPIAMCPGASVLHLETDHGARGRVVHVAECLDCGFVWHGRPG